MRGVRRVHTPHAKIVRSRSPFWFFSKLGAGVVFLELPRGGGPIGLVACSCGARLARSLGLAERFVQTLDFSAVEPLGPNLQRCAEGFGCA